MIFQPTRKFPIIVEGKPLTVAYNRVFLKFVISCQIVANPARIDREDQNKKVAPTEDWTHNLLIISLMLYWLCWKLHENDHIFSAPLDLQLILP